MKKLLISIFVGIPVMMFCFFVGILYMDRFTDYFEPLEPVEETKHEITGSREYKWYYSGDRRGKGSTGDVPDGVDWGLMRDYCHAGPVTTIVTTEGLGLTYNTDCTY